MPSRERPGAILEQVLALVPNDATGLTVRYGALAERLDVAEDLVRGAVAALKRQGRVRAGSAGRQGVRLTHGSGPTQAAQPRAVRVSAARRAKAKPAGFCPWCGTKGQPDWRYCPRCGKKLPLV